jgi:hypothetical protein
MKIKLLIENIKGKNINGLGRINVSDGEKGGRSEKRNHEFHELHEWEFYLTVRSYLSRY